MGQLWLIFLCNFSSFFSLRRSCHCYWLTGRFWQHTRSICDTLFDLKRSSELPQKKPIKTSQGNSSQKSPFFAVLMYTLYGNRIILSSSENINSKGRVSRISFCILWLCLSRWSCSGWLHHFQFDKIVLYDKVTLHRVYFQMSQS